MHALNINFISFQCLLMIQRTGFAGKHNPFNCRQVNGNQNNNITVKHATETLFGFCNNLFMSRNLLDR